MKVAAVLAMIGMVAIESAVHAQQRDDESVFHALWDDPRGAASFFSESFLRQVPVERVAEIIGDLAARCGTLQTVRKEARPGRFTLQTAHCALPAMLHRDHSGEIVGLWFEAPARRNVSLDDVLKALKRFDGTISYAVLQNGTLIAGHAQDEPLAVGSAFKLAVLAVLRERIDAKEAHWADTVTLSTHHVSLPTGRLRTMPPGSPLTLHTLAAFMIAESDNTATDALIDFVGRDRLEARCGISPFLTTREYFHLKSAPALYRRYAAAELAERRSLLAMLTELPLPEAGAVLRPLQTHAEWYMSTTALCGWMDKVADLDITQINPGPLDKSRWQRIAFKGGSEIGVLNFTAHARDRRDRDFCVSVTWNAPGPIDSRPLAELYATLFLSLAERS